MVLPLKNAAAVLDTHATPVFAAPILLSLGKQGLRDLVDDGRGGDPLLAGEPGEGGTFALWSWAGRRAPRPAQGAGHPKREDTRRRRRGRARREERVDLFDEGERKTASGKKCKGDSVPPAGKSFRARRVDLPAS